MSPRWNVPSLCTTDGCHLSSSSSRFKQQFHVSILPRHHLFIGFPFEGQAYQYRVLPFGPALYAFNDAAFTEEDWEGIQRVGRSIKQEDPTKVGRFGIGFNSVYHITDLPCVFSSKHLAIFDPQKMMFGDDQEGYRWSLNDEQDKESLLNLKDQFQPFQTLVSVVNNSSWDKVISEEQYFKGTLFRFPLRNEASEISDTLYDSMKVTQLFDSFIADADISLLFLRNVSSIALLHIDAKGVCNNKLKVSVSTNQDSPHNTDLCDIKEDSLDRRTFFKTVSRMSPMGETRSQWLVTHCLLKQGYRPEIDFLANKLSFHPQVDVAFQLDEERSLSNGRLSCFLPLPNNESNKTGLAVHINACFGLTDNRRYIKWQEEDQKNDEAAVWNELLRKNVLPLVYLMMILDAIQLSRNSVLPAASVYNLWPDLTKTVQCDRWHDVAVNTLKRLFDHKIFHLADDETIWVSASHAVFPVNTKCSDTASAVSRLLIAQGEKLISAPTHVLKDVQETLPKSSTLKWVTPSLVRNVLRRSNIESLSKDDKYCLLEFVLSDEKYAELQGLKLLPLSDGTFTSFNNIQQNTVLIESEKFPRDIVLAYPSDLDVSPYIKKVPEEFLQYENLLKEFCVKETLSDEEIEEVLHDIKQRIDDRDPPYGDSTELNVSVAILDWMRKNEKFLKDSTPVPVMGQNKKFTLQSLSKTVFCDISAEGLDDLEQDNEEFYVIHDEVLSSTARWLKVPFLSTRILKPQFVKTEKDCFGIEQYGQSEPITQRIKNILKEYDEESDIFKELIQNAEDAGARICKFLLDFRKHRDPPETLIDEGMTLCNGPCLWIFNDELFSEEDWKNIVKVGSASKENKVEKIGKFGLGFNAVYHVSDIPSVLSGKSLLILDPNVTHLEKHILSKGNPGIKLDLFQKRLYKRFPGQFKSYEGIFDCDLSAQNINKAYNGTLIKLPFRTEEEAKTSEISSKVYNEEHIHSFKRHLTENAQTHLLFLKNIQSMSLQIVPENAFTPPRDDQIQTPLKMTREVINSTAVLNDKLIQETKNILKTGDITCHNIIDYNRAQIVKIVQDHPVMPVTQYWLLYSCFGTQDSMRMFQRRNENEHVFSLPIGGIAVPLHRDGQTEAWSPDDGLSGQAFCFLPLPIETGLPFHVNGTFAVTSNRKALCERGVKSDWNKALLKDALTSAYITTLLELKKMAQNGKLKSYFFYTFWPNRERVSREFLPMVESFYSTIAQSVNNKSLELFSNGQTWGSIDRVKFLHPEIEENAAVGDIAKKVFFNMGDSYSCVVALPSWIRNSFIQCGLKEMIKQRTICWPEFYDVVFKNLSTMDTHIRNSLVLNAIDLNNSDVDDLLKRYPCIPTQGCKKLQLVKKLVNPSGKVACLYEHEEGRFLEGTASDFLSPNRIQRLSDLGMLSEHLPLEDIIERAEKIPRAWKQDQSKYCRQIQCLVELMKDSSLDVNSQHWDSLSLIPFLPAVAPLLQQNKNTTVMKKPCDVYSERCRDVVSMTEFTVDHTKLKIHSYDPVLKILRVQSNPPVQTVLQQLLKAHQHSSALEKALLHSITYKSYEYLNTHLLEQKDPNPIIAHAQSYPFIFIDDRFVNVRRDLWKEDSDSLKMKWNQSLKVNIISPLYADLMLHLCTNMKKDTPTALMFLKDQLEVSCLQYFPCISKGVDKGWHEMISEVYRSVSQRDLLVIPTVHSQHDPPIKPAAHAVVSSHPPSLKYIVNWCSVSKPNSEDCPYFTTGDHDEIFEILDDTGMKLVPHTLKTYAIKENFKEAGVNVSEISPSTVMNFMKKRPLNDPTQTTKGLPLPIKQTLIKNRARCSKLLDFCLTNDEKKHVPNTNEKKPFPDLNGLPLLLTQDQMLRVFSSQTLKMITWFSRLFPRHEEMFADMHVNGKHIKALREGKFVKDLTIATGAHILKAELEELLRTSSADQKCQLYKAEKETITWLNDLWRFFDDQEKHLQDSKQNVFSEIKEHFKDSPILPVTCPCQNNTHYLQTMSNLPKVILKSIEKLTSILIKLGFMTLDSICFTGITSFRLSYVDPELLKTGDSGAVLEQIYQIPHGQFKLLSDDECVDLQQFLQRGIKDSKNKSEYERKLKSLPLFETISGKRERIDLHREIFILDSKYLINFTNLYILDGCDSIFLKQSWVNLELAESLKIKVLNDLEFCVKFILPSVNMMTDAKRLDLIRLLVELVEECKTMDQRIVSALRNVRFIQDVHGSYQVASYFYDEEVRLYKIMISEDRFVPKKFWNLFKEKHYEAKHLLKALGMKHEVSDKEIITFAKQIESDTKGNTALDVLKKRSELLFQTVMSKSSEKNSYLLGSVANIKFIFPVQIKTELCAFHKPFAQERDTVAISGSLIGGNSDHQYLIWTSMPILPPQHSCPDFSKKMKAVGALDTPPPEKISVNLENICRSNCQTDSLLRTREKVFTRSYAHLQSISFDASLFSDHPIILVENKTALVKANQTAFVLNHASDFRPYLYNIPPDCVIYQDFFKKIGVTATPTLQQYITVLQEIYSDSCDKENLQPNQQITVRRVVQQLLCLIKTDKNQTFSPNETLHLPSTDGKLYESSTLFFNDTVFQASRLKVNLEKKMKLLEKLDHCHLGTDPYEHQEFLQLLPKKIRPKFLSDIISDTLDEASVQYCDYEEGCEFRGWFEKHLSSAEFLQGLICLIRHESRGEVSHSEAAAKCESIFSKIQIFCCKSLHTELLLHQGPLEGSQTETDVYVQKQEDGCNFYLKHIDDMKHKVVNEVTMCLTKEINALLKNCLSTSNLLVLGQLLMCDNMEEVENTLSKHGIHNSGHSEEDLNGLPKPGCCIPEEWHDCLDMNFFNNFECGEYVGYSKDESGEYVYAIVKERLDDSFGQTSQYFGRYKIQVDNDDVIEVSSLDLFQFKREKKFITPTGPTCKDLVPHLRSEPPPKRDFPQTFEEIKREIDQSLTEIWKMSHEDKQKALRRLYLRWHPDKNPGTEELATEAFKYLQNRIEELQQGKTAHDTNSNWRDFSDFFNMWDREANSHRRGRERFNQNYSRRHYNFWSYHKEAPRPNRPEAKRWYEQAECDLRAAQNDTGGDSSEWCLFKVHQAVEKALIAAMYRRSGTHPGSCSITSLAQQVCDYSSELTSLPDTVRQLAELGVDGKKTQYPNLHPIPHIPNDRFNVNNARTALDIAAKLLVKIDQYISS
ncbi:Sacsin DnaJ -like protein subfamily C member 29 [Triplophysa tibetana]|uniref:Sacsin DnaJ-like protein subfamily C member 29 n=1 Tax=Triplophysa tibetana TaxID=1572043 RepID=A0A5A9P5W0_9TELE|nr:Sacsin DnaJ -like protein subfamily C member 29 [Triplophysa tibetana]